MSPLEIITIDDIKFNDNFKAYFFDFDEAHRECEFEIQKIKKQRQEWEEKEKHNAIMNELKYKLDNSSKTECENFIREQCNLNFDYSDAISLIYYIISAIKGKPFYFNSQNNKSLYNNVLNRKNRTVRTFFCYFHAISKDTKFYKTIDERIKMKINIALDDIKNNGKHSDFYPDRRYEPVLQKYFPKAYNSFINLMESFE